MPLKKWTTLFLILQKLFKTKYLDDFFSLHLMIDKLEQLYEHE
jgi:hypothetical protein